MPRPHVSAAIEPKGERDVTGAKKEGWHEGDLAGAIGIVIL